ncbi:MAG: sulfur carrier protein ThiS [Clostridia bacterium]|nr:sulfur carrier protein ThiS [Clostridia bacterium]
MEIILNGEKEVLSEEKTVLQLLAGLELNPEVVTININGNVVPKGEYAAIKLTNGDEVDVLMFMGGGY